jgi:phosphoribosylglycinamide formyltransferase-1
MNHNQMNIVIFGSGKGTNAEAILKAEKNGQLGNSKVVGIFSDIKNSGILKIAESFCVEQRNINLSSDSPYISNIDALNILRDLADFKPDLIVLAGFMKVLPKEFIEACQNMIINIHPSLLPSFKGLNAIERAFDYGVKISGCTIHWVSEEIDGGKIIGQAPVRRMETDDLEIFRQKIQAAEHVVFPAIIANLALEFQHSKQDKS